MKHGLFFPKEYLNIFATISFYNLSHSRADGRTVSEGTPAEAGEMEESPQAKRRRREETDLDFLRVKTKDGRDSLFVDLGKRNHKLYL